MTIANRVLTESNPCFGGFGKQLRFVEERRDLGVEIDRDRDSASLGDVRQRLDASLNVISLVAGEPLAIRYAEGTLRREKGRRSRKCVYVTSFT